MKRGVETPLVPTGSRRGDSEWLGIDWREHRRWITVGGHRVNCVEIGTGPPVLLVHGLGGNWQNWLENIPYLARDHRVIAVDLPGFGESQMPDAPITIGFYADWIAGVLETLKIDRCALVGNSMGGQIAAEVALRRPELVERLVLVDAAGIWSEPLNKPVVEQLMLRTDRLLSFWSKQVVARGHRFTSRRRPRRTLMSFLVADPDALSLPLIKELGGGTGKPGFADALKALAAHPLRARLHEIDCPTLIVSGAEDKLTPVRDAHKFHAEIKGSRLVIFPNTGHLSMVERPDEFNALMNEFLEG